MSKVNGKQNGGDERDHVLNDPPTSEKANEITTQDYGSAKVHCNTTTSLR
jgi:hypothetical protein